jgi:hypothetical protein
VAAQVNGARWLGFAVPAFAGWSFASGCLLFITRRAGWSARPVAFTTVLAVGLIAGLAFRRMRRHWYTREDGLVHLDAVLGLHNRLSSAAAGVGQWPAPVLLANGGFRWRWQRLAIPMALAACFLTAAIWLPIAPDSPSIPSKMETPLVWSQMAAAVEELKRNQVADPDALAAIEQKLEALRQQAPEVWYSQSSLEAGAALRDETDHAIASLEHNLNSAAMALSQPGPQQPIAPEKETMWNEALKALQTGGLPLNKPDLAALKQAGSGKSSLSPKQMEALQKKLGQQGAAAQSALGKLGDALANSSTEKLDVPQDQPGQTGGGKQSAPLGLRPTPTALQPEKEQALESDDMEHAALGDVMNITTGQPKVDSSAPAGTAAGGMVTSGGAGGDAVWKITPSPKEAAVLKGYFK